MVSQVQKMKHVHPFFNNPNQINFNLQNFPPLPLHHSATSTFSYHIFRETIHRTPTVSVPIMCNTTSKYNISKPAYVPSKYNVPVSISPCVSLIKSLPIKRPNKVRPSKKEKLDYIPPSINVVPYIRNVFVRK